LLKDDSMSYSYLRGIETHVFPVSKTAVEMDSNPLAPITIPLILILNKLVSIKL